MSKTEKILLGTGLGIGAAGLVASTILGALGFFLAPEYLKDKDANGNSTKAYADMTFGEKIMDWLTKNATVMVWSTFACCLCCMCLSCLCSLVMVMGSSSGNNNSL